VTPNGVQSMRTMHGRQKETPPDLGICAGYSSHSHHAQMGFALSYRDMKGGVLARVRKIEGQESR